MMSLGRREILAHRENLDAGIAQIARDVENLPFGFTEADFRRIYEHSLAARFQPALRVPVGDVQVVYLKDVR